MTVTRGTALSGFVKLTRELGAEPEPLLRKQGIDPAVVGQYDRLLTYQQVASVLGTTAQTLNRPDFAMRLGVRQGLENLGPLAVVIRHSATFADAMDAASRYLYDIAPADVIELRRDRGDAVFVYDMTLRDLPFREHLIEKSLVTALSAFRVILGPQFSPSRVTFQHRPGSPESTYRDVFGCAVTFGGHAYELHVPAEVLDRPVGGHDSAALRLAEEYLGRTSPHTSLTDHVGAVVGKLLGLDRASLVSVSKALGLGPRVLQRRLAEEGTTFERILDDVRKALAWDLAASDLPATGISALLGYSEQSSYARACRRWFGLSPRALAARRRDDGAASGREDSHPPPVPAENGVGRGDS